MLMYYSFTAHQLFLLHNYKDTYKDKNNLSIWVEHVKIILYHIKKGKTFDEASSLAQDTIPIQK
jgi:hypothetical protein